MSNRNYLSDVRVVTDLTFAIVTHATQTSLLPKCGSAALV